MKTRIFQIPNFARRRQIIFITTYLIGTLLIFTALIVFMSVGHTKNGSSPRYEGINLIPLENVEVVAKKTYVVKVLTKQMEFIVPAEISSGWVSFQYKNESNGTHFFVLEKMPEGKTLADSKAEVVPVFKEGMDLLNAGKTEEGFAAFNKLPAWFFKVVFSGGAGLTGPHETTSTTIKLDPGIYLMECYVKMPNGEFHSAHGMIEQIKVTDDGKNKAEAPKKASEITISSTKGIEFKDEFLSGKQGFAVYFEDQKAHENFMGHDVHLVRLDPDANLEDLNAWMNWSDPNAFKTPVPKGVIFLGGVQEMPAGGTGYFEADLRPGKYALVAEVPDPMSKNMFVKFQVE